MTVCPREIFGASSARPYGHRLALLLFAFLLCCGVAALAALYPEASGTTEYKKSGAVVDASHSDQGYIMAKYKKSSKQLKVRVSKGDDTYTYDLNGNGEYEIYPLQLGSGKYKVQFFSQSSGNKYSTVASLSFPVELAEETTPYLYPNQYCWYADGDDAVQKGAELCTGLVSDEQKVKSVYDFLTSNIMYDYIQALTVEKGYLPDVNAVLQSKKGICFDFSALMACMLRSQGIPTQMVIGYADAQYHAWNQVYLGGEWVRYDATAAVTHATVKQYTTERIY